MTTTPTKVSGPSIKPWGPGFLPMEDVTDIFGMSRRSLYLHRTERKVEFRLIEGVNYITLASLLAYLGKEVMDFKLKHYTYNEETGHYERTDQP